MNELIPLHAVSEQQMLRAYGQLVWQVARLTGDESPPRVYIVSLSPASAKQRSSREDMLYVDEVKCFI